MSTEAIKISATLITLNEEENLPRALESLRCCDEIVVVDSGSTDRTVEIAHRYGAVVVESDWPGYAKQKNLGAESASHDWILSIDADEALSEALQADIWRVKRKGPEFDAYRFPRMAQYLGKWILHSGWYPDRKIRFYDRRKGRWVGDFVHESVETTGAVGDLDGNLLHFTCASFTQHIRTMDRYTTLAAQEMAARGERVRLSHLLFSPFWAFFKTYFLKRGFQDGFEGLVIAHMAAVYVFAKYVKAKTMSSR